MFLTSEEAKLFPSRLISPSLAFGVNKPKKVIAYQLNVDICPHLTETNQCRIYEKRPLTCKSFPFVTTLVGSTISPVVSTACPFISSKVKAEGLREVKLSSTEIESAQKMNRYLINQCQKHFNFTVGSKLWYFDLKTKKWIIRSCRRKFWILSMNIWKRKDGLSQV